MIVYRIARQKHSEELSGLGAFFNGGRWNSKGTEMIYTASNRSLAMAEVLVHLKIREVIFDFCMMEIFIPDSIPILQLSLDDLPIGWNSIIEYKKSIQEIGDHFCLDNKHGLMRVPSAVVKDDWNILINSMSTWFNEIKIVHVEPFPFDGRLLR